MVEIEKGPTPLESQLSSCALVAAFTKHLIDLTGHIYCTERPFCVISKVSYHISLRRIGGD